MTSHTINFSHLKEISLLGIRRATVFLGLGLNAAKREDFSDYQLPGDVPIRFVSDNLPADKVMEFKDAFAKWIISCGLRELMETFAVYLDGIHRASVLSAFSKGLLASCDARTRIRKFLWGSAINLRSLRHVSR